jgi:hypothetical protein
MDATLVRTALLAAAVLSIGSATAVASQEPRRVTQQVFAVSGVVDNVDKVGRNITIKAKDGAVQQPIYVGPDLPIFDQLNRGDTVTIRFYDAYIVELTPGERLAPPSNTTVDAQRQLDRDDASVLQQLKMTVTVDAIDAVANMVTYHGFDNRRIQRQVMRPALLEGVKVGDVVTITYTRARAASITKRQ